MKDGKKADRDPKVEEDVRAAEEPETAGAEAPVKEEEASKDSQKAEAGDKKADSKEALLEAAKKEASELKAMLDDKADRLQRQMAEFDNYRKRTEKEKDARFSMGERSVIEKILPVIDNFERGLEPLTDEDKDDPFVKGMDQVYKQLMSVLSDMGVKEIPALGEKFDPELHNAVMHIDDDQYKESEIVEVFSKGYSYKGTVVRFSMVKVAN